jgi:hypothetical protein
MGLNDSFCLPHVLRAVSMFPWFRIRYVYFAVIIGYGMAGKHDGYSAPIVVAA